MRHSGQDIRLPTFFILGAAKCGTTSLYYYLGQHPDIFMSYPKEPMFFATEFHRGIEYYWNRYFQGYGGERHAGDAAHLNLYLPYVAPRMATILGKPKFIVICRQPVDRAFSHYIFNRSRGQEPLSFEDAIDKNLARLESGPLFRNEDEAEIYSRAVNKLGFAVEYPSYVDAGFYAEQIERYTNLFGKDSMKVIFLEDLRSDAERTVQDVFRFLDLEPKGLNGYKSENQAMSPLMARLFQVVGAIPGIKSFPGRWRENMKSLIRGFSTVKKPEMNPATREMLTILYREHNNRLSELTGRNLDHWN
jgi:hypothetical protein